MDVPSLTFWSCACSGMTVNEDALSSVARNSSTSSPSGCWIASAGTPGCRGGKFSAAAIARVKRRERETHLVDAALLVSDLGQRLAEDPDVVDAERRDARRDRLRHDVGRVVRAADADLENRSVDLRAAREGEVSSASGKCGEGKGSAPSPAERRA